MKCESHNRLMWLDYHCNVPIAKSKQLHLLDSGSWMASFTKYSSYRTVLLKIVCSDKFARKAQPALYRMTPDRKLHSYRNYSCIIQALILGLLGLFPPTPPNGGGYYLQVFQICLQIYWKLGKLSWHSKSQTFFSQNYGWKLLVNMY